MIKYFSQVYIILKAGFSESDQLAQKGMKGNGIMSNSKFWDEWDCQNAESLYKKVKEILWADINKKNWIFY